jgi:hypothetical protein
MRIQRNWQHRIHKTHDKSMVENAQGVMKHENPDILATKGSFDRGQKNAR